MDAQDDDDRPGLWPCAQPALEQFDRHCVPQRGAASQPSIPISVVVASGRPDLGEVLLPGLMSEADIEVHGNPVADPARLAACLRQQRPNVLLLDTIFVDCARCHALNGLRAADRATRVIVLWVQSCQGFVEDVLRNRFHGFLPVGCTPQVCAKAIRAVSSGDLWMPRSLLVDALAELAKSLGSDDTRAVHDRRVESNGVDGLTRREMQVVALVRQGCTNKEIARQLGIMEDTVKKHLQGVFGKLGVHRRALVSLRQGSIV